MLVLILKAFVVAVIIKLSPLFALTAVPVCYPNTGLIFKKNLVRHEAKKPFEKRNYKMSKWGY